MKQLKTWWMSLACVLTLSFVSCGDDVYYTMKNSDEDLCDKRWVADYVTDDGLGGTYQLQFYKNGKGQEVTVTVVSGGTSTVDKEINWHWTDDSKECLQWIYTDNSVKYLENVWVRQHYLSGELDGKQIVFVEAGYQH